MRSRHVAKDFGALRQMRLHLPVQRIERVPVLLSLAHLALAQQQREAGDVAAERRELGVRLREHRTACPELVVRWRATVPAHQLQDVGAQREAGSARGAGELSGFGVMKSKRQARAKTVATEPVGTRRGMRGVGHENRGERFADNRRYRDPASPRLLAQRGLQAAQIHRNEITSGRSRRRRRVHCELVLHRRRRAYPALTYAFSIGSDRGS